ncbi:MAG: glutamate 5-kinase [Acidimicrobiia bacterium]|nr:glutamate 5-kinase [Acidimicrobiia bacterium]NNJ46294.1 glutamate 5-kinase [Acidimicrobiia bacterium]
MRRALDVGRRVVVKVGSSSLAPDGGGLDAEALNHVVEQVAALWEAGHPTALVSSGAVAAGIPVLGRRPSDLPGFQVAAAVGQSRLMERYTANFSAQGRTAGQVLLTKDVLANRQQYLNARETLGRMLSLGVVPIVNENDSVGVEELRFGDNDRLAAVVSHLAGAGMLVLLTDTPGLFSGDPRLDSEAELITAVRHTDEALDEVVQGASGPLGSGGVATKVAAARMAAWSGVPTVIASAREPDVVARAVRGEEVGTWIDPHETALPARKLWIAFGQPAEGRITIDAGAVAALVDRGKSLLAVGITDVEGDFDDGAAVEVLAPDGQLLAKGLVGQSSTRLRTMAGKPSGDANGLAIHRDHLVVLAPSASSE